ncbi:hypothetical protein BpHYR1_025532, partial [Brachionus plicatilis]
ILKHVLNLASEIASDLVKFLNSKILILLMIRLCDDKILDRIDILKVLDNFKMLELPCSQNEFY